MEGWSDDLNMEWSVDVEMKDQGGAGGVGVKRSAWKWMYLSVREGVEGSAGSSSRHPIRIAQTRVCTLES